MMKRQFSAEKLKKKKILNEKCKWNKISLIGLRMEMTEETINKPGEQINKKKKKKE